MRDRPSPEGVLDIKSKQRESHSGIHRFFYSIERRIDCRLPRTIKTDNGSEFISKVMDKWAYERNASKLSKGPSGSLLFVQCRLDQLSFGHRGQAIANAAARVPERYP